MSTPAMEAFLVDRDTIRLCKKIGRLQAALDMAIIKLEVHILPGLVAGDRHDKLVALIATLRSDLKESEAA